MATYEAPTISEYDVVLIGAGIMSATLGVLLKELQPDLRIAVYERLDRIAGESSDAWNNAGTGHSALCELNYTPELPDGSIDISKALKIAETFEQSKQLWSYLLTHGYMGPAQDFINSTPHMSFVWGAENVEYLRKRHEAMIKNHLFRTMEFSTDREELMTWVPLIMEGRDRLTPVAATRITIGTDVNFGVLTRSLFRHLSEAHGTEIHLNREVHHLDRIGDYWHVRVRDLSTHEDMHIRARFVFIGAGGGSLPLLEKSHIHEGKGFGGFPVSGQWLVCHNEAVIERHHAKVYGKASVGSPPMSVPHLDTRVIDGQKALLFGPYAGFSTKFLKEGSYFDLAGSLRLDNLIPMIGAGAHNLDLTKYLIEQVTQSDEDRFKALLDYFPEAKPEDWTLAIAGQRVQVIKKDEKEGGILEFGTEVVSAADGSIAALLGASPGASTSVSIMLDVLHRCFPAQMQSETWLAKLREMIPTYGHSLAHEEALALETRRRTHAILGLSL
ncbi:MAG: malate dehydrogenase (quinone) [Bacteroidetes bacterium]|nr:malate dehydrogenase (quinone) [Bacteroidota bacterium]